MIFLIYNEWLSSFLSLCFDPPCHGMASMARLRLACNYRTWTACSTVSVCATNSRLAGDDECTFARSFELVVRAMTMMTRPFPRACLILDVIFGTMKLIVSRLLRTARRRRKGVLKSWISPILWNFWSRQMGEFS